MWNVTVMTWRFIMLAARKDGQTLPQLSWLERNTHNVRVAGSSPAGSTFHPQGCLFNQKIKVTIFATQVSVREDMRPFFRILKTTIYMIKRNQAWFWKIFRAIKSIIIFTFRMVLATILGLASIVAIFEWNEKPSHIHLLIFGIVSVFVVINQIVIMTYESEK